MATWAGLLAATAAYTASRADAGLLLHRAGAGSQIRARSPKMGPPRRVLADLSFEEARAMARSMGFSSRNEWDDYGCPGAYRLPKDPDRVWSDRWLGWDDWLGTMLPFGEARAIVRSCSLRDKAEYRELMRAGATAERVRSGAWNAGHALRMREPAAELDTGRLPSRPEAFYRGEWAGWEDFLELDVGSAAAAGGALARDARQGEFGE